MIVSAGEPVSTGSDHGRTRRYRYPEVYRAGDVVDLDDLENTEGYEGAKSPEEEGRHPTTTTNRSTPAQPEMVRWRGTTQQCSISRGQGFHARMAVGEAVGPESLVAENTLALVVLEYVGAEVLQIQPGVQMEDASSSDSPVELESLATARPVRSPQPAPADPGGPRKCR